MWKFLTVLNEQKELALSSTLDIITFIKGQQRVPHAWLIVRREVSYLLRTFEHCSMFLGLKKVREQMRNTFKSSLKTSRKAEVC